MAIDRKKSQKVRKEYCETIVELRRCLQISGGKHTNGNVGGNGNTDNTSPNRQVEATNRKRLSDQTADTTGKKRRVHDGEQQITQVLS